MSFQNFMHPSAFPFEVPVYDPSTRTCMIGPFSAKDAVYIYWRLKMIYLTCDFYYKKVYTQTDGSQTISETSLNSTTSYAVSSLISNEPYQRCIYSYGFATCLSQADSDNQVIGLDLTLPYFIQTYDTSVSLVDRQYYFSLECFAGISGKMAVATDYTSASSVSSGAYSVQSFYCSLLSTNFNLYLNMSDNDRFDSENTAITYRASLALNFEFY